MKDSAVLRNAIENNAMPHNSAEDNEEVCNVTLCNAITNKTMVNNIFLVGEKGIGKSTIIRKQIDDVKLSGRSVGGFLTQKLIDREGRAGIYLINLNDEFSGRKINGDLRTNKINADSRENIKNEMTPKPTDISRPKRKAYFLFYSEFPDLNAKTMDDSIEVVRPFLDSEPEPYKCGFDVQEKDEETENGDCGNHEKYKENVKAVFNVIGAKILKDAFDKDFIILDEIGGREEAAENFKKAISEVLSSGKKVLGVLQICDSEFVSEISKRADVKLIEVTHENREEILKDIKF